MSTAATTIPRSKGRHDHTDAASGRHWHWITDVNWTVVLTAVGILLTISLGWWRTVSSIQQGNAELVTQISATLGDRLDTFGGRIDEVGDRVNTLTGTNLDLLQRVSAVEAKVDMLIERSN